MASLVSERGNSPWRRRLYLPVYKVSEAARYARTSPQTVSAWHKAGQGTLSDKGPRDALSYLQLIEVAVVAAFRRSGVPLNRIRKARAYVATELKTEFPFAAYRFKTGGKSLLIAYEQIEGKGGQGKLLDVTSDGQLAWEAILGPTLRDFDYEAGLVIRWHVAGDQSSVIIDPRFAFGTPIVSGTPTWVLKERWNAGESVGDIAEDFQIETADVTSALAFEGIHADARHETAWTN